MRWWATKLRWLLLVGVLLLAAVLAGFFGLARYRAGKIWQHILARNGVNLRRESNGITWSQSSKGRTIFTVHASRATPMGNNKWALHDAVLILYGREKGRDDRIYGSEFEYDQEQGVARALGEVHMDLQAPEPGGKAPVAGSRPDLGFDREDPASADPAVIHVRTSGLVYMRKLGLATTGEPTEFRYRGITCTSRGAEFDSAHSQVRLLANVTMSGELKRAPFLLTAAHAELDRVEETADLTGPVLTSGDRGARAAHALFHLHKDGTLSGAEANGALELHAGTQRLTAPELKAVFGPDDHPQHARFANGVVFSDTEVERPAHGSARTLDVDWDEAGELNGMAADGAVTYGDTGGGQRGTIEKRQMRAEEAVATFAPGKARHTVLRRVRLTGGAEVNTSSQAASRGAGADETVVGADELVTQFGVGPTGRAVAQTLSGTGNTRLEQHGADGAKQRSTGETLDVTFAQRGGSAQPTEQVQVASAVQTGRVEVESWEAPKAGRAPGSQEVTTAHAARAVYAAGESTLTLTGLPGESAVVQQTQGELAAAQIVLHQATGDAEGNGAVVASSAGSAGGPVTHILASRARLLHAEGLSEFYGEPTRPAQLWQSGSQVQAAEIVLNGKTHAMMARPGGPEDRIHAVFATRESREDRRPVADKPAGKGAPKRPGIPDGTPGRAATAFGRPGGSGVVGEVVPEAERNAVAVTAARLDYDDLHHEAIFTGGVQMTGAMGEATAERAVALLKQTANHPSGPPARGDKAEAEATGFGPDLSASLDRLVMLGDVRLKQPGRTGAGEQLTYTAATDSFALTGTAKEPPRVTGESGSVVTGATLLFRAGDSTIVVAGAKGDAKATGPARVHTETDLKQ